jgi:hypothetical protein
VTRETQTAVDTQPKVNRQVSFREE